MEYIIRKAEGKDALEIAKIHIYCWKNSYKEIIDQSFLDQLNVEKSFENHSYMIGNPKKNNFFYVAVDSQNNVIGFCVGGEQRDKNYPQKAEVYALYINDKFHNLGIGRELLRKAFDDLKEKQLNSILIWSLKDNKQREFYAKVGGVDLYNILKKIGNREYPVTGWVWNYGVGDNE